MSYCTFVNQLNPQDSNPNKKYHDELYGFEIDDDDELFGRLLLEINQAGLSWTIILKKEAAFRLAYDNYNIEKVAAYTELDRERLLADAGIIRNKLKVNAAIVNAQKILELQSEFGTFKAWLEFHHPKSKQEWTALFKKNFKFTGGEIVNEFLMSIGFLKGAHDEDCPIYGKSLALKPRWAQVEL